MDMHTGPLLLLVQANVEPSHEQVFNTWYYNHVPTLLELPGYLWGRRYVNVVGETKYLALYTIADESYLESLLGSDASQRHDTANREFAKFEQLQGLSDIRINVCEPQFGQIIQSIEFSRGRSGLLQAFHVVEGG